MRHPRMQAGYRADLWPFTCCKTNDHFSNVLGREGLVTAKSLLPSSFFIVPLDKSAVTCYWPLMRLSRMATYRKVDKISQNGSRSGANRRPHEPGCQNLSDGKLANCKRSLSYIALNRPTQPMGTCGLTRICKLPSVIKYYGF